MKPTDRQGKITRVLVVDDDPGSLSFMKAALEGKYTVFTLESAAAIFEIVGSEKVDVILLDIVLPNSDALMITRELKDAFPQIGVILVTAYSSEERAIEAIKAGADDYLRKPYSPADLIYAVERNCNFRLTQLKREEEKRHEELKESIKQVQWEIRDPLNVIFGYVELWEKKFKFNSEQQMKEICQIIKRNAVKIRSVVEELLKKNGVEAELGENEK